MNSSEILREILVTCGKKHIELTISQDGDEVDIKLEDGNPKHLYLNIPDFQDVNLPSILSNWLEKIKTIPS